MNLHGTSTVLNDKCESAAILKVFGDHAQALKVSSNKSMIGHLMAAAGAVELVATVMTVSNGTIPPTIHHNEADPDCPLQGTRIGGKTLRIYEASVAATVARGNVHAPS